MIDNAMIKKIIIALARWLTLSTPERVADLVPSQIAGSIPGQGAWKGNHCALSLSLSLSLSPHLLFLSLSLPLPFALKSNKDTYPPWVRN